MKLLTNVAADQHRDTLIDLLGRAKEAWLFTAYLKESGLNLIEEALTHAVERDVMIEMYCGLSQCISTPKAIRRAKDLLAGKNCKLYLIDPKVTYHPKLYCFFSTESEAVEIIIGSANLTGGGLGGDGVVCNYEASICLSVSQQHPLLQEIRNFRNAVLQGAHGDLDLYEKKWQVVDDERRLAEERASKKIKKLPDFFVDTKDLDNLIDEFKSDPGACGDASERQRHLVAAREIVNTFCESATVSRATFLQHYNRLVGEKGKAKDRLWHSNGLYRSRSQVADQHREFVGLLREVRDNIGMGAKDVFARARKHGIKGVGANVITEVMNTLDPRHFAVLNEKSLDSFRYLRLQGDKKFFGDRNAKSFSPEDYAEFNATAEKLRTKYALKTMSEVDNFLIFVQRNKKESGNARTAAPTG